MRARWREFELPTRVICDESTFCDTYGCFVAEPFERGFGATVGNSLRRILWSSIEGAAVTSIKIDGVLHEFSTMENVVEDVTEIVLNVKRLLVTMHCDEPRTLRIDVERKGPITAADIAKDSMVDIKNSSLHICTLAEKRPFSMELEVQRGRGYRSADQNAGGEQRIGVIPVASVFSPIVRVNYKTESTRIGQLTNYDKLILKIWTNGTISPQVALVEASKILRKHLNPFVQYSELGAEVESREDLEVEEKRSEEEEMLRLLEKPISDLDLSVRASNCLETIEIQTIGQLVTRKESDLLKVRNFGKTTLREIKQKLAKMNLQLDMELPTELGAAVSGEKS